MESGRQVQPMTDHSSLLARQAGLQLIESCRAGVRLPASLDLWSIALQDMRAAAGDTEEEEGRERERGREEEEGRRRRGGQSDRNRPDRTRGQGSSSLQYVHLLIGIRGPFVSDNERPMAGHWGDGGGGGNVFAGSLLTDGESACQSERKREGE